MEVHPILGQGDVPQPGLWYVISSYGQYPSMRVGHTITYIAGRDGKSDKLVIIGGANPSGPFAETHILYLDKYEWDELECDGLTGRYEHCAFNTDTQPDNIYIFGGADQDNNLNDVQRLDLGTWSEHCAFNPDTQPDNIYIFGGADQANNLNDVQMLDLATEKWTSISVKGTPPSPRTCRNSVSIGNKLYVFGGGGEKAEPVTDQRLHIFDAESLSWSQPDVKGKVPKPRLGHVMVAMGNKIYLHGGMARDIFYNELHELNIETMTWKPVRCKGDIPLGCTAHAAVAISDTKFCIQGGMTPHGARDTTFVFDTVSSRWQKMTYGGPPPACRLDHAICLGYLTAHSRSPMDETKDDVKSDQKEEENGVTETRDGDAAGKMEESVSRQNVSDRKVRTKEDAEGEEKGLSESQSDVPSTQDQIVLGIDGQQNNSAESKGAMGSSQSTEPCEDGEEVNKDTTDVAGEDMRGTSKDDEGSQHDVTDDTADALANVLTLDGARLPPSEQSVSTDTEALTSLLSIEGAKQVLSLGRRSGGSTNESTADSSAVKTLVCVIHGGMDTEGEIFDDCLVWRVDVPL